MWQIQRLASPAVSPDGEWVARDRHHLRRQGRQGPVRHLAGARRRAAKRARSRRQESSETNPVWSPDGRWIAFESKRGDDENPQVYVIATAGGEARRVTKVPTGAAVAEVVSRLAAASPSSAASGPTSRPGTSRASARRSARTRRSARGSATRRACATGTAGSTTARRTSTRYAVAGGDPAAVTLGTGQQLSRADPGAGSYDISPDGKEIAFAADTDQTGVDSNFDVFVVPAAGGAARNLTTDNPASDNGPVVQPRRPLPRLRPPGREGLLRRPRAPDAARPSGRHEQGGGGRLGPLGRRRHLGPGRVARLRARSTTRASRACTRIDAATGQRLGLTRQRSYGEHQPLEGRADAGRAARELRRAADAREGRSARRRGHQALDLQRRAAVEGATSAPTKA